MDQSPKSGLEISSVFRGPTKTAGFLKSRASERETEVTTKFTSADLPERVRVLWDVCESGLDPALLHSVLIIRECCEEINWCVYFGVG